MTYHLARHFEHKKSQSSSESRSTCGVPDLKVRSAATRRRRRECATLPYPDLRLWPRLPAPRSMKPLLPPPPPSQTSSSRSLPRRASAQKSASFDPDDDHILSLICYQNCTLTGAMKAVICVLQVCPPPEHLTLSEKLRMTQVQPRGQPAPEGGLTCAQVSAPFAFSVALNVDDSLCRQCVHAFNPHARPTRGISRHLPGGALFLLVVRMYTFVVVSTV
jgi:hypothetical protein